MTTTKRAINPEPNATTESKACQLASLLGGEPFHTSGDFWVVLFRRPGAHVVAMTDKVVWRFPDWAAFQRMEHDRIIVLD